MNKKNAITSFKEKYRCFSNYSNHGFKDEKGLFWSTNEHYFAAGKTIDHKERKRIQKAKTPGEAKKIGRKVKLRSDWEDIKEKVMYEGLKMKFNQNPDIKKILLNTKDKLLIEGNTWGDTEWGMIKKKGKWIGKNKLGKLLMKLRKELKK